MTAWTRITTHNLKQVSSAAAIDGWRSRRGQKNISLLDVKDPTREQAFIRNNVEVSGVFPVAGGGGWPQPSSARKQIDPNPVGPAVLAPGLARRKRNELVALVPH